jgi:DNA invertase Pin-like site-specific DNA recombinase
MIAPGGLPAAGYIRVSTELQKDNYSPTVQRDAIIKMAADRGFYIAPDQWYSDIERGRHTTKREGYTSMLDVCRRGELYAVFVFTTSRWGRRASESLERLEELRRRRIRFFSVQQGEQQPGVVFGINALMDEEYVRNMARVIRPANLRAVKEGKHNGAVPFGYKRIWHPPLTENGRPRPEMVPDEETAWIVKDVFERYDRGANALEIARWMNTDSRVPSARRGGQWYSHRVIGILKNSTYIAENTYGVRQSGYYDVTPEEDRYRGPGRQAPLVDRDLFERAQVRLAERASSHARRHVRGDSPLGASLLLCPDCGGPMSLHRTDQRPQHQYRCSRTTRGQTKCPSSALLQPVADDALLDQVKRLQGRPWNVEALDGILAAAQAKDPRSELQAALEATQRELQRHYRMFSLIDEPSPEEDEAFRVTSREISGRIAAIKAELAALPADTVRAMDLRRFHQQVVSTDIPMLADRLAANGDQAGLRELIALVVQSAVIIERVPSMRTKWARAQVTWQPNVQTLLDAGLLGLALSPQAPADTATKQALYKREWRQRKKAGLIGITPPSRSGLQQPD